MALLIKKTNQYVKVELNGSYYVYTTNKARELEKKVTSPKEINNKYWELLTTLSLDEELLHYDPSAKQYLEDLEKEHKRYCQNCGKGITNEKYPLMKKYIKDVDKSIPKIVYKGRLGVKGETLEEVYELIKKCRIFGETEDC